MSVSSSRYSGRVKVCKTYREALECIAAHRGDSATFQLAIADSMNDPVGVNMAIVTDRILARGWKPDGYEQRDGYRVYRYADLE
jgi:hypothetical protein